MIVCLIIIYNIKSQVVDNLMNFVLYLAKYNLPTSLWYKSIRKESYYNLFKLIFFGGRERGDNIPSTDHHFAFSSLGEDPVTISEN